MTNCEVAATNQAASGNGAEDAHRRFYYRPAGIAEGLQRAGFSTRQPECWPDEFPFLADKEARFLQQHGAEEALRLRPLEPGKGSIEGCRVRIVAEKRDS